MHLNLEIFFPVPATFPNISGMIPISSTAISVSWEPPSLIDWNGIITLYEVEYNQTTFDEATRTQTMLLNASFSTVSITGLEEYTEYFLRVRAYTSMGPGPYSPPVITMTLEDGKLVIYVCCIMHGCV